MDDGHGWFSNQRFQPDREPKEPGRLLQEAIYISETSFAEALQSGARSVRTFKPQAYFSGAVALISLPAVAPFD